MANNPQSSGGQFRPMVPTQQGQPFIPTGSQQFRPGGQPIPTSNVGMQSGQNQQLQFSQPMQHLPPWSSQPGVATSLPQAMPMPYGQPNRPLTSGSPQSQPTAPHMGASGIPHSSAYAYAPSNFVQPQNNANTFSQFQPMSQSLAPVVPVGGQTWLPSGGHSSSSAVPVQPGGQQPPLSFSDSTGNIPNLSQQSSSDWQEHTAADGRRYYYNKKTKQSSWEKPFELMTPIERADASTVWKEFTTPEGKKYYYNKVTKQSKWSIPDELKLAREQAQQTVIQANQAVTDVTSQVPPTAAATVEDASNTDISVASGPSAPLAGVASNSVSLTPAVPVADSSPMVVTESANIAVTSSIPTSTASVQPPAATTALPTSVSGSTVVPSPSSNVQATLSSGFDNIAIHGGGSSGDGSFNQDLEEARKGTVEAGKTNLASLEEKTSDDEPLVFANKQEAKNAFRALLESVNVQSDWTWEQTMKEIVNDKRFGALKTPGERKQAFNAYLGHRKKIEAEERRMRQKKAREEFTKMLEESTELTSSMKWSKAVSLFENDERFKAVEKARDREDLFDSYVVELERKEKEKAAEEHKQHLAEYRKFLESCDFIKVNSQWRKVQDRLEDDERCLRLEKLDRLLVYQDYIRDLEREEEEQKKIHKEKLRRIERKNRDAFRKMMEEHIAAGALTAKTRWREYCLKIKHLDEYHAVATNTSGSTPKGLYEGATEDLEKQYHDDKTRIKDAIKLGKITMLSTWTFEDFRSAISDDIGSPPISDINLKLLYEELVERAKEKEEKEAKKRQRLADEFTKLLQTCKDITANSDWEDCKSLVEESQEYRAIEEDSLRREIFEEYIAHLQEKAKEKERKREEEKAKKEKEREEKEKRKEKERKEKEKEREREKGKDRTKDETDSDNVDGTDSYGHREDKKREKDKDRKHRKRHQSATNDVSSDRDEKEESKKSRRHGSERKKSRKHAYTPESDSESRHRRHKRDHRESRKSGGYEELEDGELGEDGEIQ
ncbi:hypothetical protein K2173_008048 [Erythroxylum novogranatense]|uniref:Pre-mRNA-processing protein 40A n=1 Tax=Erythroxylum novogranatense TaxID=1862640 RepID=A0AAV8T8H5_9ROSI|nr:hypothetical protein K2173_008048 [Erythroxylum novogranatense]